MHMSSFPHPGVQQPSDHQPRLSPASFAPSDSSSAWSTDPYAAGHLLAQDKDMMDVDMKPLDLSLRSPRQDNNNTSWPTRSSTPSSCTASYKPYTMSRPSKLSTDTLSVHRMSPRHVLSSTSGSTTSRHIGSPCLPQSRSPLMRPVSPYYTYHRQTPSPYYSYLSSACTPAENSTSLQVLSSTNRLLNALSSTSSSHLRSFEDSPSQDGLVFESRVKEDIMARRDEEEPEADVDVETEEPTYIDMDSATTVKSVSSRHCQFAPLSSSAHTSNQAAVSHSVPRFHQIHQATLSNEHQLQAGNISAMAPISIPSSSPMSSLSLASSSSCSSSSPSSSSSISSSQHIPSLHYCDSSYAGTHTVDTGLYPFYKCDNTGDSPALGQKQQRVSTTTLSINTAGDSISEAMGQRQQERLPTSHQQAQADELLPQQNPDSSSSPNISDSPSEPSHPWGGSNSADNFYSPSGSSASCSSSSSGNQSLIQQSPQLSPDTNGLQSCSGSPSNKENVSSRESSCILAQTRPGRRSFFQIDKSLIAQRGSAALLSELENEDPSRLSVLDFWISKILMEETPRHRCSADIRQAVDGSKRIRLRLVDLIELQVEQSLKA